LSVGAISPKSSIFLVICQCRLEEEAQLQQTVVWDQQKIYQLFTLQYLSLCQTVLASALLCSAQISWALLYLTQNMDLFSFSLSCLVLTDRLSGIVNVNADCLFIYLLYFLQMQCIATTFRSLANCLIVLNNIYKFVLWFLLLSQNPENHVRIVFFMIIIIKKSISR